MQAHPIDSGTAASSPTLLYAFGSVSMIWPTCSAAGGVKTEHITKVSMQVLLLVSSIHVDPSPCPWYMPPYKKIAARCTCAGALHVPASTKNTFLLSLMLCGEQLQLLKLLLT
jgi:hypothetical protein